MDLQRRHVEGALAFLLQLVVLNNGALAHRDLGDRIGEIGGLAQPNVALDHNRLALPVQHDQVPRVGHSGDRIPGGNKQQMDGFLQN